MAMGWRLLRDLPASEMNRLSDEQIEKYLSEETEEEGTEAEVAGKETAEAEEEAPTGEQAEESEEAGDAEAE